MKKGFTLIELLVVIAVIALLVGVALPNFLGARERARDAKKKAELNQVKNALRLYYNDYQSYPKSTSSTNKIDCDPGALETVCDWGSAFSVAGVVYMNKLPSFTTGTPKYKQSVDGGDTFCLYALLENEADADAAASATRCQSQCTILSGAYYYVCAD